MSRHSRAPDPRPIKTSRLQSLQSSLDTLFQRAITYHASPQLTREDIYKMLVKPKDIEEMADLEQRVEKFGIYGLGREMQSLSVTLGWVDETGEGKATPAQLQMDPPMKRLLPKYAEKGFHNKIPDVIQQEINAWFRRRWDIGRKFALIAITLERLNDSCSNIGQLKFYFNGITALLDMTEGCQDLAERLRSDKTPGRFPRISRSLMEDGIAATHHVSWALLFPKEGEAPKGEVKFFIPRGVSPNIW